MAKDRKYLKFFLGAVIGLLFFQLFVSNQPSQMCQLKNVRHIEKTGRTKRGSDTSLLFVGVMTAEKYLQTRAKAIFETWGGEVPGNIKFYSSEDSYSTRIPLVALAGVDDSYPPQKKSFMMLKHMYDNYLDKYEWFMRADDDVYVRTDRLEELLRSVDSRKPWFIGQTGKGNSEEIGLLSLENDENFCMGGPGVIFSRETLKRVAPYVEDCLRHLYTTHEDVELGRCVRRFAGISCTWNYEMQVILYHNQSGQAAFTGDLKQKEVHKAITLHPIKQPEHMYRLHKYVKGLEVQHNQENSINLHRDIVVSMSELGFGKSDLDSVNLAPNLPLYEEPKGSDFYLGNTNLYGIPSSLNRYTPNVLQDVLEWEIISKTLYSHRDFNPRKRIGSSLKEGLSDIVREAMELINSYSKQRGRIIDFKEIFYGYWRLDALHGVDLILDLLLVYRKYRGNKMTVQVRRHAYVQQTFTEIYIREVGGHQLQVQRGETLPVHQQIMNKFLSLKDNIKPFFKFSNDRDDVVINMILPIKGKFNVFRRFLANYEETCIKNMEATQLHIILYQSDDAADDFNRTIALTRRMQRKYSRSTINTVIVGEEFARAKALQNGINMLQDDDLMLFIDVDVVFTRESLERVRRNTVKNHAVYFPIVYSMYNGKLLNKSYPVEDPVVFQGLPIDEDNGFWRQFGFGIVSLYKVDYLALGGFNLMISGWGFEDVSFYDSAVKSKLKIVRTPDPNLVHVYHSVNCDDNLDQAQKNMCLGTQANTLGSLNQLQKFYRKYKFMFR